MNTNLFARGAIYKRFTPLSYFGKLKDFSRSINTLVGRNDLQTHDVVHRKYYHDSYKLTDGYLDRPLELTQFLHQCER